MNKPDHVYQWERHWRRNSLRHRLQLPPWLCWEWPWQHYRRIRRHERQRIKNGYSWYDWISFDTFLCLLLADACKDFRENSHGYPMGSSVEEWNALLTSIEEPLRVWGESKFELKHDEEVAAYEAAIAAMHLVADNLGSLWD